jgi:hypothetical protein
MVFPLFSIFSEAFLKKGYLWAGHGHSERNREAAELD